MSGFLRGGWDPAKLDIYATKKDSLNNSKNPFAKIRFWQLAIFARYSPAK